MQIPLVLTLVRLVLAPILVPIALLVIPQTFIYSLALSLIIIALGLTDFFDGFLARRLHQESELGRLLDPLADKLFVSFTLFTLIYLNKISLVWAYLIIGREFVVMGLREIALNFGFSVPVALPGKLKTVAQIALCAMAVVQDWFTHDYGILLYQLLSTITACITLYSAVSYFYTFLQIFKKAKRDV